MDAGLVIAFALALDWLLGEPRRGHPLVGFGRVAGRVERAWNRRTLPSGVRRALGVAGVAVVVAPPAALAAWLAGLPQGYWIEVLLVYFAVGLDSLAAHARRVERALHGADLDEARAAVGYMVSRDTRRMDERRVAAATIESVLENGSDSVFGALFWYLVAGAPGVVVYRLVNTLDAMWGYRTQRLAAFGWAAARLDDVLNWIPARLTVLTYAICSRHPGRALRCARVQGRRTGSPNAGRVIAAGAGALGVRLGGPAVYHGRMTWRPRFGTGAAPAAPAIGRAIRLVQGGTLLWIAAAVLLGWAHA